MNELRYTLSFDDLQSIKDIVGNDFKINIAPKDVNHICIRLYTTVDGKQVRFYKLLSLRNYFIKDDLHRKVTLEHFAEEAMRQINNQTGEK